jgi:outer membrane receptor protein involved in Fe transport
VGLAVDVPYVAGLRVAGSVENLFDVRTLTVPSPSLGQVMLPVSDFLGFPLPGRTFWATVRFSRKVPSR